MASSAVALSAVRELRGGSLQEKSNCLKRPIQVSIARAQPRIVTNDISYATLQMRRSMPSALRTKLTAVPYL